MANIVDARGLACPQPVVLTNKMLEKSDEVTTIVDNDVAKENISRLARNKGFNLRVEQKDNLFYLHLTRETSRTKQMPEKAATGPIVLLITADSFGRGSEDLGQLLMRSFMHTLGDTSPLPDKIIFLNSGVILVIEGSPVLEDLRALSEKGIDILACGTCLGYYRIKEKVAVGQITNMYDIASALLNAGKVIEL